MYWLGFPACLAEEISTSAPLPHQKPTFRGLPELQSLLGKNDENVLHQIIAQTEKLEVVREIYLLDMKNSVYRELLLVKIRTDKNERSALHEIVGYL